MKRLIFIPILGLMAACTDNMPPMVCATTDAFPSVQMEVGELINRSICFEDEEVEKLVYHVESSDSDIVYASVIDGLLNLEARNIGSVIVTIRVTDVEGQQASLQMEVDVENSPPRVVEQFLDQSIERGDLYEIAVAEHFRDNNENDILSFSGSSSDPSALRVVMRSDTLSVIAITPGTFAVTVTATDLADDQADAEFMITVTNVETGLIYEEDFSDGDPQWEDNPGTEVSVTDGIFALSSSSNSQGAVRWSFEPVKLWKVEARMRRLNSDPLWIIFGPLSPCRYGPYQLFALILSDRTLRFRANEYAGSCDVFLQGSDWIEQNSFSQGREWTKIGIEFDLARGLIVYIDDVEAMVIDDAIGADPPRFPPTIDDVVLVAANSDSGASSTGGTVEIDWVRVYGAQTTLPSADLSEVKSLNLTKN